MTVDPPDTGLTTTAHGEASDAARAAQDGQLRRGDMVDRYLVIGRLGEGGGGTVYTAHDPELDRNVAIKLVRRRGDEADVVATERALREGKAMARLAHPNVVTVHDVGTCHAGLFIAMELVDGVDLAQWLAARRRSTAEILRSFVQAGRGLAAAHEAGVVHGDFKPANVFVERGSTGRARVGDFGLAHGATDAGRPRAGTPLYMAPEVHAGAAADAHADQFSFSLALYEAVAGAHPLATLPRDALAEAARSLPPAPGPRWLRSLLSRGLRPDPTERFGSMSALVEALQAKPAQLRRRRRTVVVGAVVATAAAAWWWTGRTPPCDPSPRLASTWDATQQDVVTEALRAADPALGEPTASRVAAAVTVYVERWALAYVEICEATRVEGVQSASLLDARMSCLEGHRLELDAQLRVFANADAQTVRQAVRAASRLPDPDACRTLALEDAPPSEVAPEVAAARAQLTRSRALERSGRFAEAARAAAEALAVDAPHLQIDAALALGKAHLGDGAYDDAESMLRRAHFDGEAGGRDGTAAEAATELIYLLGERAGRPDEAVAWEPHARSAVARAGDDARLKAALLSALGATQTTRQDYPAALALFEQAFEIQQRVPGEAHPDTVSTRGNIASVLDYMGRSQDADAIFREVLGAMEATLGPEHPDVARVLGNLAGVALRREHNEEARALFARAVAIKRRVLGEDHPSLVPSLDGLALAAAHDDDVPAALRHREAALRIAQTRLSDRHPVLGAVLINHGQLQMQSGDLDGAETSLRRALAVYERAFDADHPQVGTAQMSLGALAQRRGDLPEAIERHGNARAIFVAAYGPDAEQAALATSNLARAHHLAGDHDQALALYREAQPVLENGTPSRRKTFARRMGELMRDTARPCEAVTFFETAKMLDPQAEARARCSEVDLAH